MSEWDSKKALAKYGVPVPDARLCTVDDAMSKADELGYPLVAKIASAEITHKTEHGGVILNLQNATEVRAAVQRLARITDRVLLEKMAPAPVAELIVGIKRDPQFGLALVIGAGGVFAELLRETVPVLLPASRPALEAAFDGLKISRIINGFRGKTPGDRSAAVDAMEAVVRYANDNQSTLCELDINPLFVLSDGAIAVDAFISKVP